ncbi:MAG: AbgT family transporter [Prevotella sp.]|nr:AbgT family transporter [Prevotella sp.]
MTLRKVVNYLVLTLAVAQLLLILGSWFVTAAWPDLPMRSLLSSEGIRWLFGTFAQNLLTPLLAWLILGSVAYGAVVSCGLTELRRPFTFRQRSALRFVAVEALLFLVVLLLLTLIPQAPLLSATGQLFPSAFSDGLIPFLCFAVTVLALTYGLTTARLNTLGDVIHALTVGFSKCASLWLLYIFAATFYFSLCYFLDIR